MAKRKAKGRPAAIPQPKANVKTGSSTSRTAAIAVIAISLVVLVGYGIWGSQANNNSVPNNAGVAPINSSQPQAPAMTGVEVKTVGTIDASKAKVATFKLEELSGTDCFQTIEAQFKTIGGIGQVRADYTNQLCEVQYDASKVSEAKIIDVFSKANHPGQLTSQEITSNEPAQASVEDTQK